MYWFYNPNYYRYVIFAGEIFIHNNYPVQALDIVVQKTKNDKKDMKLNIIEKIKSEPK